MRFLAAFLLVCALAVASADEEVVSTVLEFTRKLDTCDAQDLALLDGTTRMIWAYNDNGTPANNAENGIKQHTERGSHSVRLFSGGAPLPPLPANTKSIDLTVKNLEVDFNGHTGNTTTYWCTTFALPAVNKTQIIRLEPLIQQENIGTVHHILIYQCDYIAPEYIGFGEHCHGPNMPRDLRQCNGGSVMSGWAIGGTTYDFPPHVGMPMGPNDAKYALMEIHYDNPKGRKVVDSSGMRFHYTEDLRQYDAGILDAGWATTSDLKIPPGQPASKWTGWCPGECTSYLFPPGGIKLISTLLHGHTAAAKIRHVHVRNGTELRTIMSDNYYDFNLQQFVTLPEEVTVLPGDSLMTECTYDTSSRSWVTPFGLSTDEEMCLAYSVYYPKITKTPAVCLYANFTGTQIPLNTLAMCGKGDKGKDFYKFKTGIDTPLPVIPCSRVPPNPDRTTPKFTTEPFNSSAYERHEILDDMNEKVTLHWTINKANAEIRFAVEAQTEGWVGVGFSPTGGMEGADVSIGWIDQATKTVFHADRFATEKMRPAQDTLQDFYDIVGRISVSVAPEPGGDNELGIRIGVGVGVSAVVLAGAMYAVHWRKTRRQRNAGEFERIGLRSGGDDSTRLPSSQSTPAAYQGVDHA